MVLTHGADFSIRWQTNSVKAFGISSSARKNWQEVFPIYAGAENLPPIAGTYRFEKGVLTFTPQFAFMPDVNYRAVLRVGEKSISLNYQVPGEEKKPTTSIAAIYPSVAELPENLLKFYIYFSGPMSGGHIYDHIHLRNSAGKDVQLPFLEIDEELWDPTMTRLTLFLDPGRIKRGVRPLEEIGPALEVGKSFTLLISHDWKDANGAALKSDFEKKFKVTAPDRDPPNPKNWKITAPKSNTRDALKVAFDEPLDHALILRIFKIVDPEGNAMKGEVKADSDDKAWSFTPSAPWKPGKHNLIIPTIIEDLAGNNIGKAFDVDLERDPKPLEEQLVKMPFTVK